MKVFARAFLFYLLICPPVYAAQTVEIGRPAPDFTLNDAQGSTRHLGDYRGKIIVLEWTNHLCPYVKKHYDSGNMQTLQKEAAAQDVLWFSIVSSAPGMQGYLSAEEANAVIAQTGAAATAHLLDPEGTVGRLYDAKTTPHQPTGQRWPMQKITFAPRWLSLAAARRLQHLSPDPMAVL